MVKQIRDYVVEARLVRESKEQKNEDVITDFKEKSANAVNIVKNAGFKLDTQLSKDIKGYVFRKGHKVIAIDLYSGDIMQIDGYDESISEDTFTAYWRVDKVSKAEVDNAAKQAVRSFNESARKNEDRDDYAKRFNTIRDKLIAKIKNMSQASNARDIQNLSIAVTTCLNNLFLARSEFSNGYSEDLDNYLNLALKAVQ